MLRLGTLLTLALVCSGCEMIVIEALVVISLGSEERYAERVEDLDPELVVRSPRHGATVDAPVRLELATAYPSQITLVTVETPDGQTLTGTVPGPAIVWTPSAEVPDGRQELVISGSIDNKVEHVFLEVDLRRTTTPPPPDLCLPLPSSLANVADLAFADDGTLYFAHNSGRLERYTRDGVRDSAFAMGHGFNFVYQQLAYRDSDDTLFGRFGGSVAVIHPSQDPPALETTIVLTGGDLALSPTGVLHAAQIAPAGFSTIVRLNGGSTENVTTTALGGRTVGLLVDRDYLLAAQDDGAIWVVALDAQGNETGRAKPATVQGVTALARDRGGRIYATTGDGKLIRLDGALTDAADLKTGLTTPRALAFDPCGSGTLLVIGTGADLATETTEVAGVR